MRTHAHVVTPSSWLFFEWCFRHSLANQIILWVPGSETLMSFSVQNAHQTETAVVFWYGCSEALKTTRRKKKPRYTMALDRRWLFQVTAELQRMPIDNSASI